MRVDRQSETVLGRRCHLDGSDEGSKSGRTRSPVDDSGLHDHWSVTSGQRGRTGLTGSTWAQGLGGRVGQEGQHATRGLAQSQLQR